MAQNNSGAEKYQYPVYYVTPAIMTVTFALTLGLMLAGKRKGIQSSGSLFIFWFLLAACGVFTYRSRIMSITDGMSRQEEFPFVWAMIYYPLVIGMLIVNCFADKPPRYSHDGEKSDNPSPEENASFLSVITYQWFDKMAWLGYKKPLEASDLWDLNNRDKSRSVVPRFDKHWEKSLTKHANKKPVEPKA